MSTHQRVLVSNLGDGNWGDGIENNLNVAANNSIYFPPGNGGTAAPVKGAEPTPAECFFGNIDYISWNTKTNWMIQVDDATGAGPAFGWNGASIDVYVGRPSGVEELVINNAGADFTIGGVGGEEICGPISYIRFFVNVGSATPTGLLCFVTAWNYGDIVDGCAATISLP